MDQANRIDSVKNPVVQSLKKLSGKAEREARGLIVIEGEKLISEALGAGLRPYQVLYLARREAELRELLEDMAARGAEVFEVSERALFAVADTKTPQGVLASFALPERGEGAPDGHLIALDGVQDPGNVGTILRTADAAGYSCVLLSEGCADTLSPKVVRASMGSAFRMPIMDAERLEDQLTAMKDQGFEIIVSALDGDDLYHINQTNGRFILVVGSEARGISEPVRALADRAVKIPMRGGAESLNAAVAAGIVMYELTRSLD